MRPLFLHLHIMSLINTLSAHENDGKQVTEGFESMKDGKKCITREVKFELGLEVEIEVP